MFLRRRGGGEGEWGVFKRVGESFYARLLEYLRMKFVKWSFTNSLLDSVIFICLFIYFFLPSFFLSLFFLSPSNLDDFLIRYLDCKFRRDELDFGTDSLFVSKIPSDNSRRVGRQGKGEEGRDKIGAN